MKKILFTVTNELNYDQRMQRICTTLQNNQYEVVLIGRSDRHSQSLGKQLFAQKRLYCIFLKGPFFYIEYNIRLFLYLLFQKADAICAIDLDTILPVLTVSKIKRCKRIYDAHELFTEMKEIVTRPKIHRFWCWVEKVSVPKFSFGYTVNQFIKNRLHAQYQVEYAVVRNLPIYDVPTEKEITGGKIFLYQGAVNEGRGFETLIPAMQSVDAALHIYGKGNYLEQTKALIQKYQVSEKVKIMGTVSPEKLKEITPQYFAGIMIVENKGLSLYYSLANKFFDFMMAGIPQICIDFPEYHAINAQYHFAYMIPDIAVSTLSRSMTQLIEDDSLYASLKGHCREARKTLNWNKESSILLEFYKNLFLK